MKMKNAVRLMAVMLLLLGALLNAGCLALAVPYLVGMSSATVYGAKVGLDAQTGASGAPKLSPRSQLVVDEALYSQALRQCKATLDCDPSKIDPPGERQVVPASHAPTPGVM